jgi:transposase-like protein
MVASIEGRGYREMTGKLFVRDVRQTLRTRERYSWNPFIEMMGERGVAVDHSTLNRWVIKYAPEIEKQFRRRQRPVGRSWRMDETYGYSPEKQRGLSGQGL